MELENQKYSRPKTFLQRVIFRFHVYFRCVYQSIYMTVPFFFWLHQEYIYIYRWNTPGKPYIYKWLQSLIPSSFGIAYMCFFWFSDEIRHSFRTGFWQKNMQLYIYKNMQYQYIYIYNKLPMIFWFSDTLRIDRKPKIDKYRKCIHVHLYIFVFQIFGFPIHLNYIYIHSYIYFLYSHPQIQRVILQWIPRKTRYSGS